MILSACLMLNEMMPTDLLDVDGSVYIFLNKSKIAFNSSSDNEESFLGTFVFIYLNSTQLVAVHEEGNVYKPPL